MLLALSLSLIAYSQLPTHVMPLLPLVQSRNLGSLRIHALQEGLE